MPNCRFSIDGAALARNGNRSNVDLMIVFVAVEWPLAVVRVEIFKD